MPRPTSPYGFLTWLCRQQVATALELALETPQVEIPTDWLGKAKIFTGLLAAAHIGAAVRKIITGITPSRCLVHNILEDTLVKV
jgi:hypothetical protein